MTKRERRRRARLAFYNDFDPFAVEWVRRLVKRQLIPQGDVSGKSIKDLESEEIKNYHQVHLFCGIAGWPRALQLAAWPNNVPIWTGSCPCQPFSISGKGQAEKDSRHLWPSMFRLIKECRPFAVFGEQVTGSVGFGWLDDVSSNLEAERYAVGAVILGAHSVGSPQVRQRLYWVADSNNSIKEVAAIQGQRRAKFDGPTICVRNEAWPEHAGIRRKSRITEILEKADGIPERVGRVRAYGNAIVPQVGAEFIKTFLAYKAHQ